jgi:phospholipase/carboxylesterase
MLSLDAALRGNRQLAGLALLSGTLLCVDEWTPLMPGRKGLPVFQTHGTRDPLLSVHTAQDLRDLLVEAAIPVEWHEFDGAHEIPLEVLTALRAFLLRTLSVR